MGVLDSAKLALRKMRGGVPDMTSGSISIANDAFWKFCNDLWESAQHKEKESKRAEKYWDGELENKLTITNIFKDQTHSNDNIIQPIVETKVSNLLDAQAEISVVPEIGSFSDMNAIKDCQSVADVLNDEIKNIERNNNSDIVDEMVARDGENTGIGASQVEWSIKNRPEGEVLIENVPAKDLRWIDNVLIAYKKQYSIQEAKELYCKDKDGNFVEELCKKMDEISEIKIGNKDRKYTGGVISYQDSSTDTAGQAFATKRHIGGVQAGRIVNFIIMYLLDDSCYAPEEDESQEESEMKMEFKRAYPNGRKIVFNASTEEKLIIADEALPESFRNLGNIDVYNPKLKNGIAGESPLKVLYPIQDRIDGLYNKYRLKVMWDIDTRLVDETFGFDDSSFVNGPLTRIKDFNDRKGQMSEPLTNDGILKGEKILDAIDKLKASAYEKAGINQTMLSGYRQTGTTSADQVDALQESPMVRIRRQQRNFNNYKVERAKKILMFIMQNYTDQRFIQLSAGVDGAKIAQVKSTPDGQKSIEFLQEVEGVVKSIKTIAFNNKWQYKVECTAGTGVPRSRKDMGHLIDEIMKSPVMASGDLDKIDLYLTAKDFPQRRAYMSLLRTQQEQANQPAAKVSAAQAALLKSPQMGQAFADIFKSLTGFPNAQGQILRMFGFDGTTGTITSLPASEVTAKSSALDIAAVAPAQVSENKEQAIFGNHVADSLKKVEMGVLQ